MVVSKVRQLHKTRLTLTLSFLTQPFLRYSTSTTTSVTLMLQVLIIFIGNSVVDKH